MKINNNEKFIKRLQEIKPDIQVLEKWNGSQTKIKFHCKRCDLDFYQTPNNILKIDKYGCSNCAKESRKNSNYIKKLKLSLEDVENKLKELYNDNRYTLLEKEYKNNKQPMLFKCNQCGENFKISYVNLCKGKGCPNHKNRFNSKNSILIKRILLENNIKFETEVIFEECINLKYLSFDFLIYINNKDYILIEYDGEFHFRPYDNSKINIEKFEKQKINDKIKNDFCEKNNIILKRITYKDNVENCLKDILKEYNLID